VDWTDLAPEDKGQALVKTIMYTQLGSSAGNPCLAEKILDLQEGLCSMLV
jgi:hypothetical protein